MSRRSSLVAAPVVVGQVLPFDQPSAFIFTAGELAAGLRSGAAGMQGRQFATSGGYIPDAAVFELWSRFDKTTTNFSKSFFNPQVGVFAGTNVLDYGSGAYSQASDGIAGDDSGVWLAIQTNAAAGYPLARSTNNGATWVGQGVGGRTVAASFVKLVNGKFWAGLSNGELYSSADGSSWTLRHTASTLTQFTDIAWSGARYVATGAHTLTGALRYAHSTDGVTFTEASSGLASLTTTQWSLDWDATIGKFCAVGYGSTSSANRPVMYSASGTTWTEGTSIPAQSGSDAQQPFRLRANGGRLYLGIVTGSGAYATLMTSTDGATFAGSSAGVFPVCKSGAALIAAGVAVGSGAYRPAFYASSGGGATMSYLSDWNGLGDAASVPTLLFAASPAGHVLSIAMGTAGTRGVFYAADTSLRSLRAPALTRLS